MALYTLKHKNRKIMDIEIQSPVGHIVSVIHEYDRSLLPPRAARSSEDLILWWDGRSIPRTRINLSGILDDLGVSGPGEYLVKNLGLSLTDCYWICPYGSDAKWEQVSFFAEDNMFKSARAVRHNSPEKYTSYSFSPDSSTGGDLPKWWIKENDRFFLVKGNMPGSTQQSYNELFASRIHSMQGTADHVNYSICRISGGESVSLGCKSECFTSSELEFIPAWDIVGRYNIGKNVSLRNLYIDECVKGGLDRADIIRNLDYMALTDFLISNTDRHLCNFGILRDSSTLKYVKPAPLFDSGNSMFHAEPWNASPQAALREKLKGFYSTLKSLLAHVSDYSIINLNSLPSREEVIELYGKSSLNKEYISAIADVYESKIRILENLQEGKSYYDAVKEYCR
ncbi:MAG: hypothetical protein ACI4NM_06160 [Bullifex sp.]